MAGHRLCRIAVAGGAVLAVAGCQPATEPAGVRLVGAVYTDVRVDVPCDRQTEPGELSDIVLTFRDGNGTLLGTASTGELQVQELPRGPGTETWLHGGCRFLAPYAATLPVAGSYSVTFDPPDPPADPGVGYFDGANQLEAADASFADLSAAGFAWSFEAPPAYVVP